MCLRICLFRRFVGSEGHIVESYFVVQVGTMSSRFPVFSAPVVILDGKGINQFLYVVISVDNCGTIQKSDMRFFAAYKGKRQL